MFSTGCIPVILSDAMVVPFSSLQPHSRLVSIHVLVPPGEVLLRQKFRFFPWPEVSLKLPMGLQLRTESNLTVTVTFEFHCVVVTFTITGCTKAWKGNEKGISESYANQTYCGLRWIDLKGRTQITGKERYVSKMWHLFSEATCRVQCRACDPCLWRSWNRCRLRELANTVVYTVQVN